MKKTLIFLAFMAVAGISQAQILKKLFSKPDPYTNLFLYYFVKPVDVADSTLDATNTERAYWTEAFKRDENQTKLPLGCYARLKPVIGQCKENYLKKILALTWAKTLNMEAVFRGRGFTANFLGQGSFFSEREIHDPQKFDQQQIETLERDKDKEKFEIRSDLPIDVCGKIVDETFYLTACPLEEKTE